MSDDILSRYYMIEDDIRRAKIRRQKLVNLLTEFSMLSVLSREGMGVDEYANEIDKIDQEIAQLEAQLPCYDLLRILEPSLYDLYAQKYPVNRHTKVLKWDLFTYGECRAPIIRDMVVTVPYDAPISLDIEYDTFTFENWAQSSRGPWFRLAYAAKLNTVFVAVRGK